MERRKESRVKTELAVRVSGFDADGQVFSQLVTVQDVSGGGARLQGVRRALLVGTAVTLQYHGMRAVFTVVRVEQGSKQGEVGLQMLPSQPDIWSVHISKLRATQESEITTKG
jgi:hypothetical protein